MDPVILEVLWARFIGLVEEAAKTLIRTSFSHVLSEAGDLSAALFDSQGRMLAQSDVGSPGHIDTLPAGMARFMDHFPPETLDEGDVLIGNNAYQISGHLLDITIVSPAISDGRVIGYFASTCHVKDVGGVGFSAQGESIFEEGLHIPYLKYRRGTAFSTDIQAIIASNSRSPAEVLGDLNAQVIANDVVIARLMELMDEFSLDEIDTVGDEIIHRSEVGMREAISQVPNGTYGGESTSDGFDEPVLIKCKLTVEDDQIDVDFAGSSPASRKGINVCLNYAKAYTTFTLKSVLAPDVPNNDGVFRTISVDAPPGSILNADHPVPITARHTIGQFATECVMRALYRAVPDRVVAESATGAWIVQTMGDMASGNPFTYMMFAAGGMGARPADDGLSVATFPSNSRAIPIEIVETGSPIIIHEREFRPDSGGAGQFRGGLGQTIRMSVRTGRPWRLPALFDRTRFAPRGLDGGRNGAAGEIRLNDGEMLKPKSLHKLGGDDVVTLKLPGGGGYGAPETRTPELVLRDVLGGYVSREMAEELYKVVLARSEGSWRIDWERTEHLRGITSKRAGVSDFVNASIRSTSYG